MNKKQLNELLNSLTLKQKIGQLVQTPGVAYNDDATATGVTYLPWLNAEAVENAGSTLNIFDNKKLRAIQKNHLKNNPVPLIFMSDIINGYRLVFPSSIAQGCSFNPSLTQKAAKITAYEASKCGVSVTFSPMIDVARNARWGRISEGYGETTLLNKDFGVANVKGYQGDDLSSDDTIAACVKHFAAYGATYDGRDYNEAQMSENTLKSVYLPPFEACVKAGARLIMPAFNTINGVPCTANKKLLKDTLREKWQFDGVVISDYGAVKETADIGGAKDYAGTAKMSLECGVDIDMVSESYYFNLEKLVENGEVDEKLIDQAVMRVLMLKNDLGILDDPYKYIKEEFDNFDFSSEQHEDFAKDFVCQSSVLLKNENTLPLKKGENIAFIGPFVDENELMTNWSRVTPHRDKGISIKEALDNKYVCLKGSRFAQEEISNATLKGINNALPEQKDLIKQAVKQAKKAKSVVLCLGEHRELFGEASSRSDISLPTPQKELFDAVYEVNQNVTVVLFAGRPLEITDISKKAKAILYVWYPGTYGAKAIVDMLFGDAVPSGKLDISLPQNVGQTPIYLEKPTPSHIGASEKGGINHAYSCRWIDVTNYPLYPFGYGLSYTKFKYSDIKISKSTMTRDEKLSVFVEVTNEGDYDAYETVQLYINDVVTPYISTPQKNFRGYKKVFIKAGETAKIEFEIDEEMLKYYNINDEYVSENGEFKVFVGESSDTKNFVTFTLE